MATVREHIQLAKKTSDAIGKEMRRFLPRWETPACDGPLTANQNLDAAQLAILTSISHSLIAIAETLENGI